MMKDTEKAAIVLGALAALVALLSFFGFKPGGGDQIGTGPREGEKSDKSRKGEGEPVTPDPYLAAAAGFAQGVPTGKKDRFWNIATNMHAGFPRDATGEIPFTGWRLYGPPVDLAARYAAPATRSIGTEVAPDGKRRYVYTPDPDGFAGALMDTWRIQEKISP